MLKFVDQQIRLLLLVVLLDYEIVYSLQIHLINLQSKTNNLPKHSKTGTKFRAQFYGMLVLCKCCVSFTQSKSNINCAKR